MEEQSQRKVEHTQCQRLRHCIQGAVASLIENDDTRKEWTALRVKLLLSLIPQNPTYPLGIYIYIYVCISAATCIDIITDDCTFYGALVKNIKKLLKEREELGTDKEWVLREALDEKKLQIGGTFQNVLTRKFDEVITPIFAAILSFIDQYSNLDIIKPR